MSEGKALCYQNDNGMVPDDWFRKPGTLTTMHAKQICMECDLYMTCQAYGLQEGIPEGVFGGLDARDRRRIWERSGGRPHKFEEVISQAVNPGLIARREYENFDALIESRRAYEAQYTRKAVA